MKRITFYYCPVCGNVLSSTGRAEISCCGRLLEPLKAQTADEEHRLTVTPDDGEIYITFPHEMEKAHHIAFVAAASWDRMLMVRLYPEQSGEVRLPYLRRGVKYYFFCTQHGLFRQ